jgi:hypothetical protein
VSHCSRLLKRTRSVTQLVVDCWCVMNTAT